MTSKKKVKPLTQEQRDKVITTLLQKYHFEPADHVTFRAIAEEIAEKAGVGCWIDYDVHTHKMVVNTPDRKYEVLPVKLTVNETEDLDD